MVVLFLYLTSWLMRPADPSAPEAPALVLAFAGGAMAMATGWLGGELVDRLAIGVDDGAHVDAPSSLSACAIDADFADIQEAQFDRRQQEAPIEAVAFGGRVEFRYCHTTLPYRTSLECAGWEPGGGWVTKRRAFKARPRRGGGS